jgi:hypothetical protein
MIFQRLPELLKRLDRVEKKLKVRDEADNEPQQSGERE